MPIVYFLYVYYRLTVKDSQTLFLFFILLFPLLFFSSLSRLFLFFLFSSLPSFFFFFSPCLLTFLLPPYVPPSSPPRPLFSLGSLASCRVKRRANVRKEALHHAPAASRCRLSGASSRPLTPVVRLSCQGSSLASSSLNRIFHTHSTC